MKLEIESAVNFLTHLMRLSSKKKISEQKLNRFSVCLQNILENRYKFHWYPERPFKGSGYRAIRIFHRMDPIIKQAGEQCGISPKLLTELLPLEMTIWIDPQEVSYRFGSDSSIHLIYEYKEGIKKPWTREIIQKNINPCNIFSCFN